MMQHGPSRARRLVPVRRVLFVCAVIASAALAAVLGFAAYLFIQGYSGGGNPQSVAPLAFPISFLVVIVVGLPTALVCAVAWIGYRTAAGASRRSSR